MKSVFPKHQTIWEDKPDGEAAVFAVNHAKAYGPVVMGTNFPKNFRPWVISDVCFARTFPAFARKDFFHPQNPFSKAMFFLLSYLLVPLAMWIFRGIEAIPAYFDRRSHITIQKSVQTLMENKSVVLFPENRVPFSEYNEDFSSGFVYVARRYYVKTGKLLKFYPVYACSRKRTIAVGHPIVFDPGKDFRAHREEIKNYLRNSMTDIAKRHGCPPEYRIPDQKAE